jgi:hypothetical protein
MRVDLQVGESHVRGVLSDFSGRRRGAIYEQTVDKHSKLLKGKAPLQVRGGERDFLEFYHVFDFIFVFILLLLGFLLFVCLFYFHFRLNWLLCDSILGIIGLCIRITINDQGYWLLYNGIRGLRSGT